MVRKIVRAIPIIVVIVVLILCISKPEIISKAFEFIISKFNSWFVPKMTDAFTSTISKA